MLDIFLLIKNMLHFLQVKELTQRNFQKISPNTEIVKPNNIFQSRSLKIVFIVQFIIKSWLFAGIPFWQALFDYCENSCIQPSSSIFRDTPGDIFVFRNFAGKLWLFEYLNIPGILARLYKKKFLFGIVNIFFF